MILLLAGCIVLIIRMNKPKVTPNSKVTKSSSAPICGADNSTCNYCRTQGSGGYCSGQYVTITEDPVPAWSKTSCEVVCDKKGGCPIDKECDGCGGLYPDPRYPSDPQDNLIPAGCCVTNGEVQGTPQLCA